MDLKSCEKILRYKIGELSFSESEGGLNFLIKGWGTTRELERAVFFGAISAADGHYSGMVSRFSMRGVLMGVCGLSLRYIAKPYFKRTRLGIKDNFICFPTYGEDCISRDEIVYFWGNKLPSKKDFEKFKQWVVDDLYKKIFLVISWKKEGIPEVINDLLGEVPTCLTKPAKSWLTFVNVVCKK